MVNLVYINFTYFIYKNEFVSIRIIRSLPLTFTSTKIETKVNKMAKSYNMQKILSHAI